MTDPTTFGAALRQFRKRAGLGVFDLAVRMGWKGTGPVIALEKDRRVPRINTIDHLGEALKLTYSDISYLRGLAGYGPYTSMPSKSQIITVLEAVVGMITDYPYPIYITDFRGVYWLINENEATLRGVDFSYLERLLERRVTAFEATFDSRLDVRDKLVNREQIEREQIFRFKAHNLFRRHESFYLAYPDYMCARLLSDDYARFEQVWQQVELDLVSNQLLYPFGGFQSGRPDLQIIAPDGQIFAFQRIEQQILHVNDLFDLIYYRPAGNVEAQQACARYFEAHRPANHTPAKLWELIDIDAFLAEYDQPWISRT